MSTIIPRDGEAVPAPTGRIPRDGGVVRASDRTTAAAGIHRAPLADTAGERAGTLTTIPRGGEAVPAPTGRIPRDGGVVRVSDRTTAAADIHRDALADTAGERDGISTTIPRDGEAVPAPTGRIPPDGAVVQALDAISLAGEIR
jgi:hypothetical protein